MPIKAYFKGHGTEVMAEMKQRYGKRGEEMFHRTANKRKMTPTSKMPRGASMSPHGDVGMYRQMEATKAGGFTGGKMVSAAAALPVKKVQKA